MKGVPALKFILSFIIVLTILIVHLNPPKTFALHKVFQDNFNANSEGSFPNGWVLVNDPDRNPCAATWKVKDGMAGIAIVNQGSCTTNIMLNDGSWNNLGDNYIFELDMKFVNGTDHNVAFRFTPSFPSNDWYDLHFQSPGDFVLERVNPGVYNVFIPQNYPNNQTYHVKIVVNKNNIKVFIDNLLVRDYTSNIDSFPTGRIALRAGTGADPSSETYFDNIVVTNIDDILPVPYFSQNALPWGPSEYDHAKSLKISNPTMNNWGCAVTSAAMMLNYHKMMEFADGTPIDPGSLNNWLKTHNGYATGKGKGGWYSSIIWSSIGTLTKNLYNANKAKYKLTPIPFSSHNKLNEDLLLRNIAGETVGAPPIIKVTKVPLSFSHYVVPKGLTDNSVAINDPEWNYTNLTFFDNNDYTDLHRYIPSQTNLSSLYFVVNPDVDLLIMDSQGRKTGKQIVNGETQEFSEIPNAVYTFESPISNPGDNDDMEHLGTGVNVFFLPEPIDGDYQLLASSQTNEGYTINIALFDADGDMVLYKPVGAVEPNQEDTFDITYSQADNSSAMNIVTFQSTIDDITQAQNNNLITRDSLASNLVRTIEKAEDNVLDGRLTLALRRLEHFERTINRNRGDEILEEAYQILLNDVNYLKTHL